MPRTAILSAMHEELSALLPLLTQPRAERRGGRTFSVGHLDGHAVVLGLTGIGKVAAAATAAIVLDAWRIDAMLLTGVAGGLGSGVSVGDVVVASALLQHDLDASPLFPRFEVPMSGRSHFATDARWSATLARACDQVLALPHAGLASLGLATPRRHTGLIVTGDRFVSTAAEAQALRQLLPDALAVEMEGAALAQVCADFDCPLAVLRTVSDRADDNAHIDFTRFVSSVAAEYAHDIVRAALRLHARP